MSTNRTQIVKANGVTINVVYLPPGYARDNDQRSNGQIGEQGAYTSGEVVPIVKLPGHDTVEDPRCKRRGKEQLMATTSSDK